MTKTSKKSEAKLNIDLISVELKRLHKQREHWEMNAYKRSNEQLYKILADCHMLLVQLRGEVKLRKKLTEAIETAGYVVRSNTSIELKVVRAVFGIENKRIDAYTRVLQIAKRELPANWTLQEWIEEHGGIEEVRRKPKQGITQAEKMRQYRQIADQKLANAQNIGKRFKPDASLMPSDSGDFDYAVALVRIDSDGKASLVFGTNKNALVKAVITEAGLQFSQHKADTDSVNKHTLKRQARDALLASDDQYDLAAAA
jgi:hypothetical protein